MIEIRQMKHILALSKYENFKRASESVFLSQPALSLSIKSAEEWFGQKLFERGKRRVSPTAFGEIVIQMSENIIALVENTMIQVKQISGLEGSLLRIGLSPLCSELVGKQLTINLLNQFPNNTFQLLSNVLWENGVESVKGNVFDIMIEIMAFDPNHAFYEDKDINFIRFDVPQLIYYCRAGHPITKLEEITYTDIIKYPFASQILPPLFREWLIKATDLKNEAGLESQIAFITNDRALLKTAVLNSNCISGAVYPLIEEEIKKGLVKVLNVKWKVPPLKSAGLIVYNANKPLIPLTVKIIEAIKLLLSEIVDRDRNIMKLVKEI